MTQLSIFFGSDGHLIKPPVSCHSLGFVADQPLVWPLYADDSGEQEAHHAPAFQATVACDASRWAERTCWSSPCCEPETGTGWLWTMNSYGVYHRASETICQPTNPVRLSIPGFAYKSACCVGVLCQRLSICCVFPSLIFQSHFRLRLG